MAILNYTTTVSAEKAIGEIYAILTKAKAKEISFENDDDGNTSAIKFMIVFLDNPLWFRLQPNVSGVLEAMQRDRVQNKFCNARQAQNTAWRILKDAIEAQLAIVQSNQGEMAQVFLPYAVDGDGRSVFQHFTEGRQKLLAAKNE